MIYLFKQFSNNGRMCFSVTEVLRYSVSAAISILIAEGIIS